MDMSAPITNFPRHPRLGGGQRNGSNTVTAADNMRESTVDSEAASASLANGSGRGERRTDGGPDSPRDATTNRIRTFMGRTPSAIKSKFLSVLGNSTEIINGISNKVSFPMGLRDDLDYRGILGLQLFVVRR